MKPLTLLPRANTTMVALPYSAYPEAIIFRPEVKASASVGMPSVVCYTRKQYNDAMQSFKA